MLPDGVIGNTWAFGAHIPGSSPGRVAFAIYYLVFIIDYLEKEEDYFAFDGEKVNMTNIGDSCYTGSGTVLIAPLELKDGSNVSAGTVVSQRSVNELGGKAKIDVS